MCGAYYNTPNPHTLYHTGKGMRKRERERGEEKREGETRTQSYDDIHRKKKKVAAGDDWR